MIEGERKKERGKTESGDDWGGKCTNTNKLEQNGSM